MSDQRIAKLFLREVRRDLRPYLRRINRCLGLLSEEQIWWRPNPASNSAGNLVLHLCGNMRQWIISGLGGAPDARDRDAEFAARGALSRSSAHQKTGSRRALLRQLNATEREVEAVLRRLTAWNLARRYTIQGFQVTGLAAVAHVYSHFTYHGGQIAYLTKLQRGQDLRLTKLPADSRPRRRRS